MHTLDEGKRSDRGRGMHNLANVVLMSSWVRKGLKLFHQHDTKASWEWVGELFPRTNKVDFVEGDMTTLNRNSYRNSVCTIPVFGNGLEWLKHVKVRPFNYNYSLHLLFRLTLTVNVDHNVCEII